MAEGKKSFVLYCDLIHTVRKMPKEKVAELFLTILSYVNDEDPKVDDYIIDLVFEPIKHQLKRDLKKWEKVIGEKKDSGQLGNLSRWHPDLYEQVLKKQLSIEDAAKIVKLRKSHTDKNIAPATNISHTDKKIAVNVTVNDTVTDKDNTISNSDEFGDGKKEVVVGVIKGKEKKVRPAAKKKTNPDAEPYWKQIRAKWIWFNKTHLRFNVEPIPDRDYSHIHRIIEKLRERATGEAVLWTEENALTRWEKFLTVAYTKDDWLHNNFLASNLEGKMQKIFNLIDNPNGTHQQTTSGNKIRTSKSAGAELLIASLKEDLNAGRKQSN